MHESLIQNSETEKGRNCGRDTKTKKETKNKRKQVYAKKHGRLPRALHCTEIIAQSWKIWSCSSSAWNNKSLGASAAAGII